MNTVTITANESGTRTAHVELYEAESRIAAAGAYRSEAELLLAFAAADVAPKVIVDSDGDTWSLLDHDGGDEYVYAMA
jgi:hypothetical protein